MASPNVSSRSTVLSTVILIATAAISCALFFYFIDRTSIRVPVYDLLDWLRFYDDRMRANDWLGYLWTPHNEHRIVFSRILVAIDIRWLGGRGLAFAVFGATIWISILLATARIVTQARLSPTLRLFACSMAVLILSPTYVATTISMPASGVFMQTPAFALLSVALLDNESGNARMRTLYRICALVCACFCAFGVSAGLLIWPVLIWLAWRAKLGITWMLVVVSIAILFTATYIHNMPTRAYQSLLEVGHFLASIDYGIRFLGLPWSHAPALEWPARAIGLLVLILGSI